MKHGLILEGGAMRGLFTAGVIDVFIENGITFDGMIGVSAGATFGCNLKSKQAGRTLRYNLEYADEWRYGSIRSLFLTGDYYGKEFAYHELPTKLDVFDVKTFAENPMEFYVVTTDIDTGEPVYHKCETAGYADLEWIRASASMPVFAKPVYIGGRRMLDGGISDSIPVKAFEDMGYDRNVVVLTRPAEYRKKPMKGAALKFMSRYMRHWPRLLETMKNRAKTYNETVEEILRREQEGTLLVVRPPEDLGIKRTSHDREEFKRVYEIGRRTAEKQLDQIKAYLQESTT